MTSQIESVRRPAAARARTRARRATAAKIAPRKSEGGRLTKAPLAAPRARPAPPRRPPAPPSRHLASWLRVARLAYLLLTRLRAPVAPRRPVRSLSALFQLNAQTNYAQGQAATCAAGGALDPYNPTWAPWPVHAWPDAGSKACTTLQSHATYIQTSNAATIAGIQANMGAQNC
jgi:hypothetical protein